METQENLLIHQVSNKYEEFHAVIDNELTPIKSGLSIQQHFGIN